jgi:hypothetical protein
MRAFLVLPLFACLAAPPASAEFAIAPGGPCAVAPQRDPCAEGACSNRNAKVRGRFSPDAVAAGEPSESVPHPTPAPLQFEGPGSCVDPSTGCGKPRVVDVVRFEAPSPVAASGPPSAPPPTVMPNPPTPPPAPIASNPTPPAPPAPPVVPPVTSLPLPPAPPGRTPPSPPPVVVEPPPGPVLPPGANPVP